MYMFTHKQDCFSVLVYFPLLSHYDVMVYTARVKHREITRRTLNTMINVYLTRPWKLKHKYIVYKFKHRNKLKTLKKISDLKRSFSSRITNIQMNPVVDAFESTKTCTTKFRKWQIDNCYENWKSNLFSRW